MRIGIICSNCHLQQERDGAAAIGSISVHCHSDFPMHFNKHPPRQCQPKFKPFMQGLHLTEGIVTCVAIRRKFAIDFLPATKKESMIVIDSTRNCNGKARVTSFETTIRVSFPAMVDASALRICCKKSWNCTA